MDRQFVEDRIVEMDTLPFTWNVERSGPHYFLCLKMSRLKQLAFAFEFGSVNCRQPFPKTEFPEGIVKFDISLNEVEELPPEALFPFENLAELDASLNALGSMKGLGVLPGLVVLDVSYNRLTEMKDLASCARLSILRLSHNRLRTLTDAPLLSNLTQLDLSSNQLRSLDGVQNLPRLHELHVQKNRLASLLPLACLPSLSTLDASCNDVRGLPEALSVLRGLRRLKQLRLKDNPVVRDNRFATAIKESTSVEILDGTLLRGPSGLSTPVWPFLQVPATCSTRAELEEAARRAFHERLQQKKGVMEGAVHHLHSRILEMQEEMMDYEEKLRLEMEACMRYIQMLPSEGFPNLANPQEISDAMEQYQFTKFWERWRKGRRAPVQLPYKELTEPKEVVKAAAYLLSNPPGLSSHTS